MNKYNYASFAGKVAAENDPADVPAPEQPQPPAQTLAQPQPSSYYVTAAAYDPETHAGYTACPDEETPPIILRRAMRICRRGARLPGGADGV